MSAWLLELEHEAPERYKTLWVKMIRFLGEPTLSALEDFST